MISVRGSFSGGVRRDWGGGLTWRIHDNDNNNDNDNNDNDKDGSVTQIGRFSRGRKIKTIF